MTTTGQKEWILVDLKPEIGDFQTFIKATKAYIGDHFTLFPLVNVVVVQTSTDRTFDAWFVRFTCWSYDRTV